MPVKGEDLWALTHLNRPRAVETDRPEVAELSDVLPLGWSFAWSAGSTCTVTVFDRLGAVHSSSSAPRLADAVDMAKETLPC